MAKKVCLLHKYEVAALRQYNIRPDCSASRHAHISKSDAADMMLFGTIEIVQHYFAENGTYATKKDGRVAKEDHGTIRSAEMEANAGSLSRTARLTESQRREMLAAGKIKREEDFAERAQAKVAWWPFIADKRSVTVVPRASARDINRAISLYSQELAP